MANLPTAVVLIAAILIGVVDGQEVRVPDVAQQDRNAFPLLPESRPLTNESGRNARCDDWLLATESWSRQQDVVGCSYCHYGNSDNPLATLGGFVKEDALAIWLNSDKHAVARQRVEPVATAEFNATLDCLKTKYKLSHEQANQHLSDSNQLSWRICETLNYDVASDEGYLKFRDNCLTCHGGYAHGSDDTGFSSRGGFRQAGLSCNFCHQVGDNDAWVSKHRKVTEWRLLPPEEKQAFGMRDLVSMSAQAANCNDCHVGNIQQNRFVTHDMYAAGHPPLPSFELQTFACEMPRHWKTPAEVSASLSVPEAREYFKKFYPQLFTANPTADASHIAWDTRKLLTGALQSRRHWLQLLGDAAQNGLWGDYALYDCLACHHELRTDSRRQQRGFPGVPGRPREAFPPRTLFQQAWLLTMLDATPHYQRQLDAAFDEQPFGSPLTIHRIATEGIGELDQAQARLNSLLIDDHVAREVLANLTRTSRDALLEYDSARNVVWAIQQISKELIELQSPGIEATQQRIDNLGRWGDGTVFLNTALPARQDTFLYRDLQSELPRRARYLDDSNGSARQDGPARLQSQLEAIREQLEALRH